MKKLDSYELIDLRTFLAVVECGSIGKAALSLGIAKSVVSQRLRRLEGGLGVALLRRSHLGVRLTAEGEHFWQGATEALELLEVAVDGVLHKSTLLSGVLKVCAPMTFGTWFLSPVLLDFLKLYPKLELHLELQDRMVDLAAEGYDLGVRITRSAADIGGKVTRLGSSRRVVCCSPGYATVHGIPRSLQELKAHPRIGYSNDSPQGLWHFPGPSVPESALPKPGRVMTNNGEVMRDAALAGLGLAILPVFIVHEQLRNGSLVLIPLEVEPTPDHIFVLSPFKSSKRRRVQVLEAYLEERFAGQPSWELGLTDRTTL